MSVRSEWDHKKCVTTELKLKFFQSVRQPTNQPINQSNIMNQMFKYLASTCTVLSHVFGQIKRVLIHVSDPVASRHCPRTASLTRTSISCLLPDVTHPFGLCPASFRVGMVPRTARRAAGATWLSYSRTTIAGYWACCIPGAWLRSALKSISGRHRITQMRGWISFRRKFPWLYKIRSVAIFHISA